MSTLIKLVLFGFVFFVNGSLQAQFTDNFSDGDFTINPTWSGEITRFDISTGQFHLNAPAVAESSYLSTGSSAIHNASWEFYVQMGFATSSTNLTRIYLVSDQPDLKQSLNGYFVMIGNTDDEVSLYRQTGTTITKIIDGLNARVGASTVIVKVKVTRDVTGLWSLFVDVGNLGSYTQEDVSLTDVTHTVSNYFGVYCLYTATRSTLFRFDDFVVTGTPVPDLIAPTVTNVEVVDQNSLLVEFNEEIDVTTSQNAGNYSVNSGIGNPASATIQAGNKSVLLALSNPLTNGANYSIQISGVQDLAGNPMAVTNESFFYFVPQPVSPNDIIVSEFMADPTPVVGLPEAEFIELFNRSANPVNLLGWKLTDGSSIATLPDYILMPASQCVVTSTTNASLFSGSLGVSNFPSLNNTGDNIILKDDSGTTIDSIYYSTTWHNNDEKKDGGWAIELIDSENLCGEESNWKASENALGGTPGSTNSVKANNPDNTDPKILSISVKNSTTIEVLFNEKMDGGSVGATASPSLNFSSIEYTSSLRQLVLTSTTSFDLSTPYTVKLSNVNDCSGNALEDKKFEFVMAEKANKEDLLINEVLFNPRTGGVDFVEVYNASAKYIDLKKWTLANYESKILSNQKTMSASELIIAPKSYKVFTTDIPTVTEYYSNAIESTCVDVVLPSLLDESGTVALVDSLQKVIDYFFYKESYHTVDDVEGVSLERISINSPANDSANWKSSIEPEYFATPGYKNSASYPFVASVEVMDSSHLLVAFSAPIEVASAEIESNFFLNQNMGNPAAATMQPGSKTVLLVLANPLTNGLTYAIQISGIKDTDGTTLNTAIENFTYFIASPVNPKDIIVNEIVADPAPVIGLPEAEFVELYNRSANPINLAGWTLSDGSSVATLRDYILLPSKYCVITSTANSALFSGAIGVSNFPSLNNTGDNIILKDANGLLIDSIRYSLSWYHSDEKKDGGWSIERIDPDNFCGEEDNWKASENVIGGTPGAANSVLASNPDMTSPEIVSLEIINSNTIEILFNEKMDGGWTGALSTPAISFSSAQYSSSFRQLTVVASSTFLPSTPYTVTISGVKDCSGNLLQDSTINFIVPETAQPGDLVINEILFNPSPGGVDFVELYNPSNKYINLQKWALANYNADTLSNVKRIDNNGLIMPPQTFRVFTPDTLLLKEYYPNTEAVCIDFTLPSMLDAAGSIALVDSSGNVFEYFLYKDSYHLSTLDDTEGISLERISTSKQSNDSTNWKSSTEPEFFATPGYKNSTLLPLLSSVEVKGPHALLVIFSGVIDGSSAQNTSNFLISQNAGNPANAALQADNMSILLTLSSPLVNGLNYEIQVFGIRTPDGELLSTAKLPFLFFISAPVQKKDIIISEFMADPAPVVGLPEAEFVELYNRSVNPVNLQGWKLSDGSTIATLPAYILQPLARCVVTPAASSVLFAGSIGVSNFASFNNTSDNIILKDNTGRTIDSIYYSNTWYKSDEKKDGGWSLELIDPENLCEEEGNWTASENVAGGTPGTQNSVNASNPDLTAPVIQSTMATTASTLEILFNERMDGATIPAATIEPSIAVATIQFDPSLRKIFILTNQDFQKSTSYMITLSNVYDCSGNSLENNSIEFVLPEIALPGDISINEILFNPKSGGVDFVELYNRSNKYLSMKKWAIASYDEGVADNPKEIETVNPVISPQSFRVFTSDPAILKAHYPRAIETTLVNTTLPSLPDDEGSIAIVDSSGNVMDHFFYSDDYHVAFLKDDEGVSLERISLDVETENPNNWRSASQAENFATPSYKNSTSTDGTGIVTGEVTVDPEIFSPEVPPNDFTRINYRFGQSGNVANASIYDHQGRVIKILANNEVLGVEGFFRWDGDRDEGGRARAGYYVVMVEIFDSNGGSNTFRKRVVIGYQ